MTRLTIWLCMIGLLTACGVDGEPVRPTVSGAVTINDSGVYPSVGMAVDRGPVSLFLGL